MTTPKKFEYVIKFLEDEPTIGHDERTPRQLGQAFADARTAAFGAKGKGESACFVMDSGVYLISTIKSISELSDAERALIADQNSLSTLRYAQAKAIAEGELPPDGVARDGSVIPLNEQGSDEDKDEEGEDDEEGPLLAPAGVQGVPAAPGAFGGLSG